MKIMRINNEELMASVCSIEEDNGKNEEKDDNSNSDIDRDNNNREANRNKRRASQQTKAKKKKTTTTKKKKKNKSRIARADMLASNRSVNATSRFRCRCCQCCCRRRHHRHRHSHRFSLDRRCCCSKYYYSFSSLTSIASLSPKLKSCLKVSSELRWRKDRYLANKQLSCNEKKINEKLVKFKKMTTTTTTTTTTNKTKTTTKRVSEIDDKEENEEEKRKLLIKLSRYQEDSLRDNNNNNNTSKMQTIESQFHIEENALKEEKEKEKKDDNINKIILVKGWRSSAFCDVNINVDDVDNDDDDDGDDGDDVYDDVVKGDIIENIINIEDVFKRIECASTTVPALPSKLSRNHLPFINNDNKIINSNNNNSSMFVETKNISQSSLEQIRKLINNNNNNKRKKKKSISTFKNIYSNKSITSLILLNISFVCALLLMVDECSRPVQGMNRYYWPLRKVHHSATSAPLEPLGRPINNNHESEDQIEDSNQNEELNGPLKRHQLLIGQQYSNFSSIVPYSLVQDSDYIPLGNPMDTSEDQTSQGFDTDFIDTNNRATINNNANRIGISSEHQLDPTTNILMKKQSNDNDNDNDDTLITTAMISGGLKRLPKIKQQQQQQQDTKSRALLPSFSSSSSSSSSDSNRLHILPQMQQIKSRFNQGCVGGTKCQFFAFCWMSGGSLGASCGLLMTCCVTPSRQEIQPGFYGPVVNDPYCGRSTSKINRIVGGTDASFGQFPWQAFVQVGGSRCGGALISSRHVVTAGHCVARSQHSPSSIKVTLGDYILNSDIESIPHEVFSVVEVFLHPNFRFTPQADRYDVAVLELDRQASYKDNIKPICLPQKDAIFVGRVAYVAGWGALQAGSKLRPKVLQHVAVPVIENQVCESWHRRKGIDIRIYDEMMCAGYELGQRDACQGDSGGPLMLNQFGVWYLVGIVSAGYSCAKQYQPGIYHRVSSSSDWISSNVYQQGVTK